MHAYYNTQKPRIAKHSVHADRSQGMIETNLCTGQAVWYFADSELRRGNSMNIKYIVFWIKSWELRGILTEKKTAKQHVKVVINCEHTGVSSSV